MDYTDYQLQRTCMFSGMRRGLKSIDFYQAVPSELSEGTISGACISIVSISMLVVLLASAIMNFTEPRRISDMIVDQKHLNQKLKVNIDIQFPKYPCSMLSLDIENILKVHEVNIGGTIQKINTPDNTPFVEAASHEEKKRRIVTDFRSDKGCRMKGWFEIDRVPGNFHFSCHGYGNEMQEFLNDGGYRDAHRMIDMSHIIHSMYFGEIKDQDSETFSEFESHKEINENFLGISYTYFLDIVESNSFNEASQKQQQSYFYTVRMNEVILASAPMVLFKYETNPITILTVLEYTQWHQLFVRVVGIIGGIFTVATIVDSLVHSSIHFLLEKDRLGKLK